MLSLGAALASGCITHSHDHDDDDDCCGDDGLAPLPPVGVTSTTGDRRVDLDWIENQEEDLDGYRIYYAREPHGSYDYLGSSGVAHFTHAGLSNGETYYYGVTSVDIHGNESDLNDEIVYDTPRPAGFGLVLGEADGPDAAISAFDFSAERRVHWDSESADVYFDWIGEVPYLAVPDLATDIQDAGFARFDAVGWAPESGWSPSGIVEAIEGHVYVVWTRDDHYAKIRVASVDAGEVELDWAYQSDRGNPELRKAGGNERRPRASAASLRASS